MCTNIKIKTIEGNWITGRTNEFSAYYNSDLLFLPRNFEFQKFYNRPDLGTEKLPYAMIGETTPNAPLVGMEINNNSFIDGMNEFGLSVSNLYFPVGFNWKVIEEKEMQSNYISAYVLPNWILGNCKNTKEVRTWIEENNERIVVLKTKNLLQGFHFAIVDAVGDSIVIEPENGRLNIKENPSGVMTNCPRLEWHQENLANFINLDPVDIVKNPKIFDNKENPLIKRSMGNGIKNLPGDWSAPSRYIRAYYLSQYATKPKTIEEGVITTFRILHTADLIGGTVVTPVPNVLMTIDELVKTDLEGSFVSSHTDNILVKELTNKIFYYKDIHNISLRFAKITDYLNETEPKRINFDTDETKKFQEVKLI